MLGSSGILNHDQFTKWFKFVKLCMVMVLGNVEMEDEHISFLFFEGKKRKEKVITQTTILRDLFSKPKFLKCFF